MPIIFFFFFFFGGSYVLRLNLNQQQWQPAPLDAFQAEITSFFSSVLFNRPLFDSSALCFFSFSPSLSLCLLVFLYLMKGPHSLFFFSLFESFWVAFQNSSHALGLCERWDHQHWGGSPHLLACYLVSSSIKSPPPPLKFCLHLVSLCLWCLLLCIQMRKVWFEAPLSSCEGLNVRNEDSVLKFEALRRDRGPPSWHKSIPDVCGRWKTYQLAAFTSQQ